MEMVGNKLIKIMTYYIILDGEDKKVIQYDSGILGDTTKTFFYPNKGFGKLCKIIEEFPDMLETITILDDTNKKYTANDFLKKLNKLKIATH